MSLEILIPRFGLTSLHLLRRHAIEILKRDSDISRLLPNILPPEVSPCFTIDIQSILYCSWYPNAKFMGGTPVFLLGSTLTCSSRINTAPLHPWNSYILGLQWVLDPPVKCWIIIDIICDHVLRKLQGALFFQILDIKPFHRSIFQLNLQLTSKNRAFWGVDAILRYSEHKTIQYCTPNQPVITYLLK